MHHPHNIIFIDCTKTAYNGKTAESAPLGGIERCTLSLAENLAQNDYSVSVINNTPDDVTYKNVRWLPTDKARLVDFPKDSIVIANNDAKLFDFARKIAGHNRFVPYLWLHNRISLEKTIRKGRLLPLLKWNPTTIFPGTTHLQTTSKWIPLGHRHMIPHGIPRTEPDTTCPSSILPPHAIFFSQSYRGLDHIIRLWETRIHPKCPEAELHVYSDTPATNDLQKSGIILHGKIPKTELLAAIATKRASLIPGHKDETFCLAAAESIANGCPVITFGTGALKERVTHQKTGYVAQSEDDYAEYLLTLLTNDTIWAELRQNCLNSITPDQDWPDRTQQWISLFHKS